MAPSNLTLQAPEKSDAGYAVNIGSDAKQAHFIIFTKPSCFLNGGQR